MEPITLNVSGKIETVDGKLGQLEATTTTIAEKACEPAIVGLGTTDIEVEFPEQAPIPIESKLIAFNGGTNGGTTAIFIPAFPPSCAERE